LVVLFFLLWLLSSYSVLQGIGNLVGCRRRRAMFRLIMSWTPANKRFLVIGLTLTITAQMVVLATEYLSSVWPLWFGSPVILKTAPVDPRSLFRGNYVRLNYDISLINKNLTSEQFKINEVGYVTLKKEEGVSIATGLYHEKPKSGVFIRGRVSRDETIRRGYSMKYGIEAYFMPKKKAHRVEHSLRQGANAEIYLLPNGKSAIAKLNCTSGDC
jgi:uncharacterized membrane-anchored protein